MSTVSEGGRTFNSRSRRYNFSFIGQVADHSNPADHIALAYSMNPFVSVVIATYNREQLLLDTIAYVLANEYPEYELIVVDQTREHTQAFLDRLAIIRGEHDFTYIHLTRPSLPLARNVGILHAKGDTVLFCDDDVIVEPDFILRHAQCYTDATVGAVGGRIVTPGSSFPEVDQKPEELPGRIYPDGSRYTGFYKDAESCDIHFGIGCNMSFRAEALSAVGGFDERFTNVAFDEDVDAFVRVRKAGYRARFSPQASVVHLKSPSGGCRNDERVRSRQKSVIRSRALFDMKHGSGLVLYRIARSVRNGTHAALAASDKSRGVVLRSKVRRLLSREFIELFVAHIAGMAVYMTEDPDRLSNRLSTSDKLVYEPGSQWV